MSETTAAVRTFNIEKLLEAAKTEGFMLRNSEEYNKHEFKGGELVVSENGVRAVVLSTINKRPEQLEMTCLACDGKRKLKSQDFFQVTGCSEKCKKAIKKSGFVRAPIQASGKKSSKKSDRKVLEEALNEGLITQSQYQASIRRLDEQTKEKREQANAANKARGAEAKREALRARLKALGMDEEPAEA